MRSSDAGGAHALCRLTFPDNDAKEANYPVQWFAGGDVNDCDLRLCVKVHSIECTATDSAASMGWVFHCTMALACAFLVSGTTYSAMVAVLLAWLAFVKNGTTEPKPPRRLVKFSIVGVDNKTQNVALVNISGKVPKWVGRWKLDKSCSEQYGPILADLGVNFLLRKAADAANSEL